MKPLAKLGVGCAVVAAVGSVGLVLVGPRLVREAARVVEPISKVQRAQAQLDKLVDDAGWKPPQPETLAPDELDRFFAVRAAIGEARLHAGPSLDKLPRKHVRSLEELKQVPDVIHDVTGVVGAELEAFVAARMPPAQYHWIERLIYARWRSELKRAGTYPAAARAAADEIAQAAASERDPRVRARLEQLAAEMRARQPQPPEGINPAIHQLLLSRVDEVERLSLDDVVAPYIPMPR
jgi:hypothetical protein